MSNASVDQTHASDDPHVETTRFFGRVRFTLSETHPRVSQETALISWRDSQHATISSPTVLVFALGLLGMLGRAEGVELFTYDGKTLPRVPQTIRKMSI